MKKTCQLCEKIYTTRDKRRKFCAVKCYQKHRRQASIPTPFFKGHVPWNKGTKGVMKVNSGSFKKGQPGINWLPVGTRTKRRDKNNVMRNFIKVSEPNKWLELSHYVWLKAGRSMKKGFVLHHKNLNSSDDSLKNLILVSRQEHPKLHNRLKTKNVKVR